MRALLGLTLAAAALPACRAGGHNFHVEHDGRQWQWTELVRALDGYITVVDRGRHSRFWNFMAAWYQSPGAAAVVGGVDETLPMQDDMEEDMEELLPRGLSDCTEVGRLINDKVTKDLLRLGAAIVCRVVRSRKDTLEHDGEVGAGVLLLADGIGESCRKRVGCRHDSSLLPRVWGFWYLCAHRAPGGRTKWFRSVPRAHRKGTSSERNCTRIVSEQFGTVREHLSKSVTKRH